MWSAELMAKIQARLETHPPDIIHIEHLRTAPYGLRLKGKWPMVWDAIDKLSLLYQDAAANGASLPLRLVSMVEAARLAGYEKWLTGQFPATVVIAQRDYDLFRQDNPHAERVKLIPLGLPMTPPPDMARAEQTLIITGTLNYHPNVASVQYFVHDIFPLIQRERPDVRLQLVGANPPPAVRALQNATIEVTGFVPSISDYLGRATAALAPVLYGSGMQIKVLEAFLTATPLVATSVALRGLDVRHEEHVLMADTPADFAQAVERLLDDTALRARIGQAGRRYVEQHHDLARTTQQLVGLYEDVIQGFGG
jgi:glycosyltransferase involved in cell wall biosynthesis